MSKISRTLEGDGAVISDADVDWIVATLAADLAHGYDGDPAIYAEHVRDVVGALIGRGISPTQLRAMMAH